MTDEEKKEYRDKLVEDCMKYNHIDYDDDKDIVETMVEAIASEELMELIPNFDPYNLTARQRLTGRVKIIRVTTEIKEGRKEPTTEVFYECWCDVQSLGTNEKYTALQAGLENTIVFKVRNCKRMKEVRKKMKEFYAEYDGTRFDIYDASPMFTDNGWVLVKGRAVA